MKTQSELQTKLEGLFESKNVYYQPPENLKMDYPAIRYSKYKIESEYADDMKYLNSNSYQIIVIDQIPDNPVINKILELPYSFFDRHYVSNNLNHYVFTLYW